MAWLLALFTLALGALFVVLGVVVAGVLGLFGGPWLGRRHRARTIGDRAGSAATIDLEQPAYHRVDIAERR